MSVSPEEFFMYLTIALIALVPISARLYRYFTAGRTKRMLREEFGAQDRPDKRGGSQPR
ncbi:MAG: hypothetical protein AB1411_00820 [Nitrospirota bacterium]